MSAPLFTNVADPVERLPRTHEALSDMKERHRGNLDVGIVADRDQMPDVQRLTEWLRDGVAEPLALSSPAAALSQSPAATAGTPSELAPTDGADGAESRP